MGNNFDKFDGKLSIAFQKYMVDEKQVSFICSQGIWKTIFKFLTHHRELNTKKLAHPDSLFGFSERELDRFVAQQIGGFFSLGPAAGFATLWGVPYLYDFLLAKQIIRPEIHQRAITAATELKKQLTEGFSQLWKFDFVHRWLPPDSVSQEDWDAEIKKFAASLTSVTPLSDEPGQGRMESLYRELGQLIDDTKEEELPDSDGEEVDAVSPPSVKSYKPPKPKKSPLQEAAKLLAKEPKKPGKKPKKGFDSL